MDADELIKEFLAEHVDLVVTDMPQVTIVINAWHKDSNIFSPRDKWQYLIWPADDPMYGPVTKVWYYTQEVPSYAQLIDKYWEEN